VEFSKNAVLGGRLQILQPLEGFRVAMDSVFLAASVPAVDDERILDLGCGPGAASLCLLARCENVTVRGIERQAEYTKLAQESARINGFHERFHVIEGDVQWSDDFPAACHHVDGVMMNPPFFQVGNASPVIGKAEAHHEDDVPFSVWVKCASRCLKPKGHLTIIHAADRLTDILEALQSDFGAVEVIPLWPKLSRDAKRVIVRGVKGRRTPLRMRAGLVLHDTRGGYTPEADAVLRDGACLDAVLK